MSIEIIAELVAKNGASFALMDDNNIRGGFRCVTNLTERNSISSDKLKYGMKVFVQSTDLVYQLQSDLITWIVDTALSQSLQSAYNNGNTIQLVNGSPFIITDGTNNILTVSNDDIINFNTTLCGQNYTSNITINVATNSSNIIVDTSDKTIYRAIQYFYTISNSDASGYETGQLYLIQDGLNCTLCDNIGNSIGTPVGSQFSSIISGNNLNLMVTTDNSGAFSRIVHLFKVALI